MSILLEDLIFMIESDLSFPDESNELIENFHELTSLLVKKTLLKTDKEQ